MRLATLPCQVLPKTSLTINAPVSGQLRLYIDRPQTNLPADFVWAEFEPRSLNMEAAELAEAQAENRGTRTIFQGNRIAQGTNQIEPRDRRSQRSN